MKNVVFVCGPDRTGKTEITKSLSSFLGVPRYKASTEHNGFLSNQERFLNDIRYSCPARLDLLKQLNSGVVYDRGYPCEWVYSRFFKRQTDDGAIKWLDSQYAELGAVIVITARRSFKGIVDDLNDSICEPELNELSSLYNDFASVTSCRVLKLYVDDENLQREISDIVNFLNSNEMRGIKG